MPARLSVPFSIFAAESLIFGAQVSTERLTFGAQVAAESLIFATQIVAQCLIFAAQSLEKLPELVVRHRSQC